MKTILTFFLISVSIAVLAQNTYEKALANALEVQKAAVLPNEFRSAANLFERISAGTAGEWLPRYYAAQCYIVLASKEPDNATKDKLLDKAQEFIDQALKLAPDESELYALQAFVYPMRMAIDPAGRGIAMMGMMDGALDTALKLNPENPRAYYLKAVITLNMPESFGGGAKVAKPIFETAKAKFAKFKPSSPLHPNWGIEQNQSELDKL